MPTRPTRHVQLDGQVDADGTANVALAVGDNAVSVVVTAEDGETTRTYTVAITRAAPPLSDDATLRSLTLSGVTLAFDPAVTRLRRPGRQRRGTETTVTPAVYQRCQRDLRGQAGRRTADADGTSPAQRRHERYQHRRNG